MSQQPLDAQGRPLAWAQVQDLSGIANLYLVEPGLYRGAQPTAAGLANAKKDLGIRCVLNLRAWHSDHRINKETQLELQRISSAPYDLDYDDIVAALRILNNPAQRPLLVHCQHGADRTGTVLATWRMVHDNWTAEQAIDELTNGGYGFWEGWKNLPRFLRSLDIPALRKELGMPAP